MYSNTSKTIEYLFHKNRIFYAGILITFFLHIAFINFPPARTHLWRQANTLAMTRNFYEEEMNILHPRVDNRFDTNGITGSQFPSYEYAVAAVYKITGEKFWVARSFSFLLYLFGAAGMYFLVSLLTKKTELGKIAFWIYLWCPVLFYYGICALPDILALPFSIWGLYFFADWFRNKNDNSVIKNTSSIVGSIFFLTIAGMTKIQYLAVGFPMVVMILFHFKTIQIKQWITIVLIGMVSVVLSVWWYVYANDLIEKSGLHDFGIQIRYESNLLKALNTFTHNFYSDLPESILNFSTFTLFVIGSIYVFKKYKKTDAELFYICLTWFIGVLIYHIIELKLMEHHDYYLMPYTPIMILIACLGIDFLLNNEYKKVLLLLIVLQPILASVRILPSRWLNEDKGISRSLYNNTSREKLSGAIPNSELCIVGPDLSNSIYFYFLHKKGWSFADMNMLLETKPNGSIEIETCIDRGAKYLYTNDSVFVNNSKAKEYFEKEIMKEGDFFIYQLKAKSK